MRRQLRVGYSSPPLTDSPVLLIETIEPGVPTSPSSVLEPPVWQAGNRTVNEARPTPGVAELLSAMAGDEGRSPLSFDLHLGVAAARRTESPFHGRCGLSSPQLWRALRTFKGTLHPVPS